MLTRAVHPASSTRDLARSEGSYSVCEELLYPFLIGGVVEDVSHRPLQVAWVALSASCSESARRVEEQIADVLSEASHLGAMSNVWNFLLEDPLALAHADIEFDDVLPPQPRRNLRVVKGVFHRVEKPWPGIALSDDELDAIYVDSGDG